MKSIATPMKRKAKGPYKRIVDWRRRRKNEDDLLYGDEEGEPSATEKESEDESEGKKQARQRKGKQIVNSPSSSSTKDDDVVMQAADQLSSSDTDMEAFFTGRMAEIQKKFAAEYEEKRRKRWDYVYDDGSGSEDEDVQNEK